MLHASYWISELADMTGVSTRTIRYYIEEGLLPSPEIQGKYAVFDEEYVYRLKLIKFLKDAYLPLREIKLLLDQWDIGKIRDKLAEFEQDPAEAARNLGIVAPSTLPSSEIKESASEYLSQVMDRTQRSIRSRQQRSPSRNQNVENQFARLQVEYLKMETPPEQDSWQRFRLGEGIELWVRQPVSPDLQRKLDSIMEQARSLFVQREDIENGTDENPDQE